MIRIWFRDGFETEDVQGDLSGMLNELNIARAKGYAYTALLDARGEGLIVELNNIIKAREVPEGDHAFIGGK